MKSLPLSGCRYALKLLSVIGLAAGLSCAAHAQTAPADLAPVKPVAAKAESENPKYPAKNAIDGSVNDDSRWVSKDFATSVALEIDLGSIQQLGGAHVFSGFGDKDAVAAFTFQFWRDGQWVDIPSATVEGNKATAVSVPFDQTLDVITNKIRLVVRKSHKNIARIKEIVLWPYTLQLPALPTSGATTVAEPAPLPKAKIPPVDRTLHQIALNQIGYATGYAKRFTAPLSADGTPFSVRLADGTAPLYRGVIRGGIGDFSDFRPAESAQRYVVTVEGGTLRPGVSDAFLIRPNLWQEQCWQPAVDFLLDTRSVVGTHPSAFGGCPWRDGNYYDAILPGLVLFYLADPARIEAMPRQIDWAADKKRVLDPAFVYDAKNPQGFGVMPAVTRYYNELEAPAANAPDVVKLLHWGAGFYLMKPVTTDTSGDPDMPKIHSQMVEKMAYIVWAWPVLKQWLPQSFYDRVRDFCFANWTPSLGISPWWDPKTYLTVDQIVGKNPMGGLLPFNYPQFLRLNT
jgi:hypothetical protein